MTILSYAFAHIGRAREIMEGTDDSSFEENSKKAAGLLRSAAGMFLYVQTRELPRWIDIPGDRPAEIDFKICIAMADYCCATAQSLTIKKALSTGTSKVVLGKLAVDVWRKFQSMHSSFTKIPEWKDMAPPFKNYLVLLEGISKAEAYKYMGQGAYAEEKWGHAVAYLNFASNASRPVWTPGPGTPLAVYAKEIQESKDDIEHVKRSYNNENEHIYVDKVPTDEAKLEIAEPKCLMTAEAWLPPKPAYEKLFV